MTRNEDELWFSVGIFLEGCHKGTSSTLDNLWEERIVILRAGSSDEACAKAEERGRRQELEYESVSGDEVHWRFRRVSKVYEIMAEAVTDGTEVFSRFLRKAEVEGLQTSFKDQVSAAQR